jgi:pheromone shutdown-related protein TraB
VTEDLGEAQPALPSSVKRLRQGEREIYLIATAHVSKQSVQDVRDTIEAVQPDTVCVELCEARYRNIIDRAQWKRTNIIKIIRQKKAMLLLSSLIMTSFQRRIAEQLGVTPGAEMVEGIQQAEKRGANLVLADRDIQTTLRRTWGMLGFWSKMKMMAQLLASLFVVEKIDEATIEELKNEEKLADVLDMLADEFPMVKGTLIDERDVYLSQKIRAAEGKKIVAVLGAGHVPGILREIEKETPLQPLEDLPPRSLGPQLLKWGIPAAIIALLIYGFFKDGAQHSLESLWIWVLVNGTLSALGALLALGHPLTVLTAFLAAPLTSLNPMIAAGWVSGLAQAVLKKPTVEDLENLPDAISSVKGFWLNPVSRILLVVVLSNLGSTLGTFIGGSWIAGRSLS